MLSRNICCIRSEEQKRKTEVNLTYDEELARAIELSLGSKSSREKSNLSHSMTLVIPNTLEEEILLESSIINGKVYLPWKEEDYTKECQVDKQFTVTRFISHASNFSTGSRWSTKTCGGAECQ